MAQADPTYAADIKAIHAMARQLALGNDSYRAIVRRVSGGRTETSKALTPAERVALRGELTRLGAGRPVRTPGKATRRQAQSAHARKIRALWIALWHLGGIPDPGEHALAGFVRRQSGIEDLAWLSGRDADGVIEALKARCRRFGFSPPTDAAAGRAALLKAQMVRLKDLGVMRIDTDLARYLRVKSVAMMDVAASHAAAKHLGQLIRNTAPPDGEGGDAPGP